MKELTTIFLDWDNTMVDFKLSEARALENTFRAFSLPFDEAARTRYSELNDWCWKEFEKGNLKKDRIYTLRFEKFFGERGLDVDVVAFNDTYLSNLAEQSPLFEGAEAVCRMLSERYAVYIVTNGYAKGQYRRIGASGLMPYIRDIFVSESVGIGKPHREYWEYVFARVEEKDPKKMMIIGDSLSSDIRSGWNMGMKTCWVNLYGETSPQKPDYEVRKTADLLSLFWRKINKILPIIYKKACAVSVAEHLCASKNIILLPPERKKEV